MPSNHIRITTKVIQNGTKYVAKATTVTPSYCSNSLAIPYSLDLTVRPPVPVDTADSRENLGVVG